MKILDRLPYWTESAPPAVVGGQPLRVRPHQIIVWVSVAVADLEWGARTPVFPAILDTGNTFTFSIFPRQLIRWAGMRRQLLPTLGTIREGGKLCPRHSADVWLHPNVPGRRDRREDRPPLRLHLPKGIAVYPDEGWPAPHLPLLGLQALTRNNLHLTIDGERRLVWLRTPDWRTRLLRWLS